jgi:hypothetical protein
MSQPPFVPTGTFDLSGYLCLPTSYKILYQYWWNTYEQIQAVDANTSTLRNAGDKSLTYYTFRNNEEMVAFKNGNLLHVARYPTSNWTPVSKD